MHAFAIVLVKPCEDVRAEVGRLLEPFNEEHRVEREDEAPDLTTWWDWWRIGGRWDGVIKGVDRNERCPNCGPTGDPVSRAGLDCHYGDEHDQLVHNAVPVIELGECRPFTLVLPDGSFRHRERWVSAPDPEHWPWKLEDDEGYDRWVIEQLLAHRECIAVGVDYHS